MLTSTRLIRYRGDDGGKTLVDEGVPQQECQAEELLRVPADALGSLFANSQDQKERKEGEDVEKLRENRGGEVEKEEVVEKEEEKEEEKVVEEEKEEVGSEQPSAMSVSFS
jgi:hypothetical protein